MKATIAQSNVSDPICVCRHPKNLHTINGLRIPLITWPLSLFAGTYSSPRYLRDMTTTQIKWLVVQEMERLKKEHRG